jgi:hypothetical protein
MGFDPLPIDWEKVKRMLMAGASGVEAAAAIGVHENTIYSRCRSDLGVEFVALRQEMHAKGNELLRRKQYDIAMSGDKTMLIWLGKNRLDQKDRAHNEVSTPEGKRIIIEVHDAGCNTQGDEGLPTP